MDEQAPGIARDHQLSESMDFQYLRKEAIALTQQMSGDNWTDYNIHDPGVTILEQFCYALTDIAYRTNLDLETLLYHGGNAEETARNNAFFPAEEIFSPGATTLLDYRILILDELPNKISNCWVNKIAYHKEGLKGLLEIEVIPKSDVTAAEHEDIVQAIQSVFQQNRNLCEDLESVKILAPEKITFSAEIEIFEDQIAQEVLAEVLFEIENYLNAPVKFVPLEELESQGLGLEEIFNVASHKHGFITGDRLDVQRKEFYVSKIADHILAVKGVRHLRNLHVIKDGIPVFGDIITVSEDKYLTMGILNAKEDSPLRQFDISVYKGGVLNKFLDETVVYALDIIESKTHRSYEVLTRSHRSKQETPKTEELVSYNSIQQSFPGIYRVGDYMTTREEGRLRSAQSIQLKSYLLFFDQLMANHLAQLAQVEKIFSIAENDVKNPQTYFSQQVATLGSDFEKYVKKEIAPANEIQEQIEQLREKPPEEFSTEDEAALKQLIEELDEKSGRAKELAVKRFELLLRRGKKQVTFSPELNSQEEIDQVIECIDLSLDIHRITQELKAVDDEESRESLVTLLEVQQTKLEEKKKSLLIEWERDLMDKKLEVDFLKAALKKVVQQFDTALERKSRLLSQLLARFGESFPVDFLTYYSKSIEGEDEQSIKKKLIHLKSSFLRDIVNLNRNRAKGMNYELVGKGRYQEVPLKARLCLLLDMPHQSNERLIPLAEETGLSARKLNKADLVDPIPSDEGPSRSEEGIRFIVPGKHYFHYLFKFGLNESNYHLTQEDGQYIVLFQPPTGQDPQMVASASEKATAKKKILEIIDYLNQINTRHEGFHLVEHLLLRSKEASKYYFILQKDRVDQFKSLEQGEPEAQKTKALDTMLLACFEGNYEWAKEKAEEYVVFIKSWVGKKVARSTVSFDTEKEAETFIRSMAEFFTKAKEKDQLMRNYLLYDERKYHFVLLGESREAAFKYKEAANMREHEFSIEQLKSLLPHMDYYQVNEENNLYEVSLVDYAGQEVLTAATSFRSETKANRFIERCIGYYSRLVMENRLQSVIRYQGLDTRSAKDLNHQLSVIYPNWTARFNNEEFFMRFKQILFQSAPAHLHIRLVGLDFMTMKAFEDLYFQYMELLSSQDNDSILQQEVLADQLLDILLESKPKSDV